MRAVRIRTCYSLAYDHIPRHALAGLDRRGGIRFGQVSLASIPGETLLGCEFVDPKQVPDAKASKHVNHQ
ncbi:hypothetical protein HaLaN_32115 [Haematococcus lacustris]|uniref:Uncharacterized protein n=1 Tax=Haematococcus lacustris TaxID=44745 RepID=A0A6A0AJR9_HAELA|nr:hypothetical protein HaLaN_32115 [Haematococcus lacustris]